MTHTQTALDMLLHRHATDPRPWKGVPAVLALAFAIRAAIALSNDFVLHPDEIMQYLEPAHRLVFGNGIQYWEHFYGARSWLVPGAIAGILTLFDSLGLGQPYWYVGGVKLTLCAVSLAIPAGMYVFARQHFGENPARIALVAGAFWYELAGFAHKPMTEFLAAASFMGLLALTVRPSVDDRVWYASILAVFTAALRIQYAPLALVLLAVVFLRTRRRLLLLLGTAGFVLAVGVFDALTWNGGLFHSYLLNLRLNLILAPFRAEESSWWLFLLWLALASGGLFALAMVESLRNLRRHGFVLALLALTLLLHSLQTHKEYRFVFVVIPLWLMIGADVAASLAAHAERPWVTRTVAAVFAGVSLAGILNLLPFQKWVYFAWSSQPALVSFVREQDPAFAAYRYLAGAPGVKSVWQPNSGYAYTPGYYYLHRKIPFYAAQTGHDLILDQGALEASVSHIVHSSRNDPIPGYSVEKAVGPLRILRRDKNGAPVRNWFSHKPIIVTEELAALVRRIDSAAPTPPPDAGIRFTKPAPVPNGLPITALVPRKPPTPETPGRTP